MTQYRLIHTVPIEEMEEYTDPHKLFSDVSEITRSNNELRVVWDVESEEYLFLVREKGGVEI